MGLSGRDGLVGAPVQLAIPNTSVADLDSVQAFDLREIPLSSYSKVCRRRVQARHVKLRKLVCGQCTRWQTAGRPGRYANTGQKDKIYGMAETSFDVYANGLAEIISTSAPTVCWRSFLSVCLPLVGDQFF